MAVDDVAPVATTTPEKEEGSKAAVVKTKRKGLLSRIWNGLFRTGKDDFEKRLEHISKEEAAVLKRMRMRSITWRSVSRHLIIFSLLFELIAVGYAIMTTRSVDMDWKRRAFRILPMFLLPCLSSLAYSAAANFIRMCDRRDQKTVERLRAERQAKIDELKERTNYYITQQLIQKYDPDPAAKAAAATVLASKLGADSGLNVFVGDEPKLNAATGKSNDSELVKSSGLRNRKQPQTRSSSGASSPKLDPNEEMPHSAGNEGLQSHGHGQLRVEHHNPQAAAAYDGGWISRIAALLVGEDPTQSYALICGNCHMHNGLAKKEDFPYITYYCPHCHALNQSKQSADGASDSNAPNLNPLKTGVIEAVSKASGSPAESIVTGESPGKACSEINEAIERVTSGDLATDTGGIH